MSRKKVKKEAAKYTREQIINSKHFNSIPNSQKDLLFGLLAHDEKYELEEASLILNNYLNKELLY